MICPPKQNNNCCNWPIANISVLVDCSQKNFEQFLIYFLPNPHNIPLSQSKTTILTPTIHAPALYFHHPNPSPALFKPKICHPLSSSQTLIIDSQVASMQATEQDLAFQWASCRSDSHTTQHLVHHGPAHCFAHFLQKLLDTGRAAAKLYILFHAIPFIIRLRKVKSWSQLFGLLGRSLKDYSKSLLFMSFLVGLLRALLCVNWNLKEQHIVKPWLGFISYMSPLSAISILFEDKSRRCEVVYHVSAKAMRSVYLTAKRVWGLGFKNEAAVMHIVIMGVLYYVYNHRPSILKYRNIFELIFGEN